MIFYYTDNSISQTVGQAFEKSGAGLRHVCLYEANGKPPIFYGILRGTGPVIRTCQYFKIPFTYVDNGYFDAVYRDPKTGLKSMNGMYRIVKNGLIEPYTGKPRVEKRRPLKVLVMPPTPYTAFMHDTIPEDWLIKCYDLAKVNGDILVLSEKEKGPGLAEQLKDVDAVLAFNSMAVMEAVKAGKAVYTEHGIIRNMDRFTEELQYFDYEDLELFYETKQFTLEEIGEGLWQS